MKVSNSAEHLIVKFDVQQMEKDADSLGARVKSLTIILMAVMHIFACAWWYIGTYAQANLWNPKEYIITRNDPNDTVTSVSGPPFDMDAYNQQLPNYWIGRYQGQYMTLSVQMDIFCTCTIP